MVEFNSRGQRPQSPGINTSTVKRSNDREPEFDPFRVAIPFLDFGLVATPPAIEFVRYADRPSSFLVRTYSNISPFTGSR